MPESRASHVYETIIRRVLVGHYQPGQTLNRREIAGELDVSISPVNEAFAVLQTEGIVETVPRKGTFIARLDRRDLVELTIVRAALEAEAARAYCGERISGHAAELFELAARVDSAQPVTYEYLHADIVFHRALAALSGNRFLGLMLDTVIARSLLLAMTAALATHGEPVAVTHRTFVRDLCAASPETVAPIVRKNIFSGKEMLLDAAPCAAARPDSSLDLVLSVIKESYP